MKSYQAPSANVALWFCMVQVIVVGWPATAVEDVRLATTRSGEVVAPGHTSVTMPPPSTVTAGTTQSGSTMSCGTPPSGQSPPFASAAPNLPVALVMQAESSAIPFAADLA